MGFNRGGFLFAVLVAAAAAELVGKADASTFIVGDNLGWRVPNTSADYSNWASRNAIRVGDVLVFNFMTGQHDVAQVTKAGYDGCTAVNPIISLSTVGPWSITINSTGEHHYICTIGSHCSLGQKLAINVTAPPSPPTSAPVPAPSTPIPVPTPPMAAPTPSVSPSPTPTPTPTPMSMPPTPMSAPAPGPGMGMSPTPSGGPSMGGPPAGGPGSAPPSMATPGDEGPPGPPSSSTLSTMSATLAVFAAVAFGLTV